MLRPFPYPDRDVWKALNLSIEWMLELRDLRAVLDRVLRDPRWPRPGEYPVSTSYVYQPDMPHAWRSVQGEYGELKGAYNGSGNGFATRSFMGSTSTRERSGGGARGRTGPRSGESSSGTLSAARDPPQSGTEFQGS